MQIFSINPFNYNKTDYNQAFNGRGKPIDLKYIAEKRSNLLPARIRKEVEQIVSRDSETMPSLKEVHQSIYGVLDKYISLADIRRDFPEFSGIADAVTFIRDTVFKKRFEERTKGIDFPLWIIKELWCNLTSKEDAAKKLGLPSRSSLEWALENINFVYYPPNYRTLIKASDEEGNREIAEKTTAYNKAHPEQMYARNKHAAQACKTDEYRAAQSKRHKERDKVHPERIEKISECNKRVYEIAPELAIAMSEFSRGESSYVHGVIKKEMQGAKLNQVEQRVKKGFWKRFWAAYPHLKVVRAAAFAQIRAEKGKK